MPARSPSVRCAKLLCFHHVLRKMSERPVMEISNSSGSHRTALDEVFTREKSSPLVSSVKRSELSSTIDSRPSTPLSRAGNGIARRIRYVDQANDAHGDLAMSARKDLADEVRCAERTRNRRQLPPGARRRNRQVPESEKELIVRRLSERRTHDFSLRSGGMKLSAGPVSDPSS